MITFDQHNAIISEKIQKFSEKKKFFDIVLIAGSNSIAIQAHRAVLCTLSEYFFETFFGNQSSALKENVLVLKEIEASALKSIIDFMYSGSIELNMESAEGILRAASFLKMKSLIGGCCEFLQKNIDSSNCLKWFRVAHELHLPTLQAKALKCTSNFFEIVSKDNEFLKLSENEFEDVLLNRNPKDDFEENVFLNIVAWINFDKLNRRNLAVQLLSMVNFQALKPEFIIRNRKPVCRNVQSYKLISCWLQWHLSPETRVIEKRKKLAIAKCFRNGKINVESFSPERNTWTIEIETHHPTKKYNSQIIVIDGKLIVIGGGMTENDRTGSVECFDLHTFKWIDLTPMKKVAQNHLQFVELNRNLCVFDRADNQSYIYTFSTRQWNNLHPPHRPNSLSRIASHNEMLYIIDVMVDGVLQSFNVSTNEWTLKKIENNSLMGFGFVATDKFLYLVGGCSPVEWIKNVQRYDLSNDMWNEMAPLPHLRTNFETIQFDNKIIISDGLNLDEYNINTNTWTTLSPLINDDIVPWKSNICHITTDNYIIDI